MELTTIFTMYKLNGSSQFLFNGADATTFPFLSDYLTNYSIFDRIFVRRYARFCPIWNRDLEDSDSDVLSMFKTDTLNQLYFKKESYQRIYDALIAEYSAIENYEKHSSITTEHGEETNTNTYGSQTNQDVVGQKQTTNSYGAQTNTLTHGGTEEVQSMMGVNSGAWSNQQKNESEDHIDTESIQAHSDSITEGSHTDSHTIGSKTDTFVKGKDDDTVTEYTHGNIGVTKNQEMIELEIKLRIDFALMDIIFKDIITELCALYDQGIDYMFTKDIGDDTVGLSISTQETENGTIVYITNAGVTTSINIQNGQDGITPSLSIIGTDLIATYEDGE